jgi:hypothetical protein
LLESDGFLAPGVVASLGDDALVSSKPGFVPGDDCVDVAVVQDAAFAHGALLGIAVPDDGEECATLPAIAEAATDWLKTRA